MATVVVDGITSGPRTPDEFLLLARQMNEARRRGDMGEVMRLRKQYDSLAQQAGRAPVDWDRKMDVELRPGMNNAGKSPVSNYQFGQYQSAANASRPSMPTIGQPFQGTQAPAGNAMHQQWLNGTVGAPATASRPSYSSNQSGGLFDTKPQMPVIAPGSDGKYYGMPRKSQRGGSAFTLFR